MTRWVLWLACVWLGACGSPKASDTSGRSTSAPADGDGDGYVSPEDCDDDDGAVHPGAAEVCSGVDEDCDGLIDEADEDLVDGRGYVDADQDGYGVGEEVVACGWSLAAEGGDCDDGDVQVHPNATETCRPGDEDCDGLTDEEDPSLTEDALPYAGYADADGDGYGVEPPTIVCNGTAVGRPGDCDDTDASVNPGAVEACGWRDLDCDGVPPPSLGGRHWYADADGDGYGAARTEEKSCGPPAGYVPESGDCHDEDPAIHPGAEEVCDNGVDEDCTGWADDGAVCGLPWLEDIATATLLGEEEDDQVGFALALPGDMDGDGMGELAVGAKVWGGRGAAFVVTSPVSGVGSLASWSAGYVVASEHNDGLSSSMSGVGDVDGDGLSEVLVGAVNATGLEDLSGVVYVVRGPVLGEVSADASYARLLGTGWYHKVGDRGSVSGGDLNGDGFGDVVAGETAGIGGQAYVMYGPFSGDIDLGAADAVLSSNQSSSQFGDATSVVGDMDGDGLGEVVVGAPWYAMPASQQGAALLFSGAPRGELSSADADAVLLGEAALDQAGDVVASVGDTNGDGYADLAVRAYLPSTVYVVLGPVPAGMQSLSDTLGAVLEIDTVALGGFGYDVSGADVDGDGLSDVVSSLQGPVWGAGGVLVVPGPMSGVVDASAAGASTYSRVESAGAGVSLAVGDVDGDGLWDVLLGAPGLDDPASDAGGAYLVSVSAF